MTFLLLLFTGGCAFWDLKKRRIPNGMLLLGGLLFLWIRFGLGMKMGYTAGWDGRLPEYGRLYYLSGVGLPGSGLHILCFICTGPRLGEASSRTIWKRGMEKRHLFVWHRACFWE